MTNGNRMTLCEPQPMIPFREVEHDIPEDGSIAPTDYWPSMVGYISQLNGRDARKRKKKIKFGFCAPTSPSSTH